MYWCMWIEATNNATKSFDTCNYTTSNKPFLTRGKKTPILQCKDISIYTFGWHISQKSNQLHAWQILNCRFLTQTDMLKNTCKSLLPYYIATVQARCFIIYKVVRVSYMNNVTCIFHFTVLKIRTCENNIHVSFPNNRSTEHTCIKRSRINVSQ